MAIKPTGYPDWATEDDSGRSEPPETMKESGFQPYDFVPRQWQNWMWWKVGEWIRWFDDVLADIAIVLPWAHGAQAIDAHEDELILSPKTGMGYYSNPLGSADIPNGGHGVVVSADGNNAELTIVGSSLQETVRIKAYAGRLAVLTDGPSGQTTLPIRKLVSGESELSLGDEGFMSPKNFVDAINYRTGQRGDYLEGALVPGTGTVLYDLRFRVIGENAELWFKARPAGGAGAVDRLTFSFTWGSIFSNNGFIAQVTSIPSTTANLQQKAFRAVARTGSTWELVFEGTAEDQGANVYMIGPASLAARQASYWA